VWWAAISKPLHGLGVTIQKTMDINPATCSDLLTSAKVIRPYPAARCRETDSVIADHFVNLFSPYPAPLGDESASAHEPTAHQRSSPL
jgi:hypothetical protein